MKEDLDKLIQTNSQEAPGGLDGATYEHGPQSHEEIVVSVAEQGRSLASEVVDRSDAFYRNTNSIAPSPDVLAQPEVQSAAQNREEKFSRVQTLIGKLSGFIDRVRQNREPLYRQQLNRPSDTAILTRDIKESISGAAETVDKVFDRPERSRREDRAQRLQETRDRFQANFSEPKSESAIPTTDEVIENIPDRSTLDSAGSVLASEAERMNNATQDAYREIPSLGNAEDDKLVDELVYQKRINDLQSQIEDLRSQQSMGSELELIRRSQRITYLQDEIQRLQEEQKNPPRDGFNTAEVSTPNYSQEISNPKEVAEQSVTIRERLHQIDALLREDQTKLAELQQSLQSETDPIQADMLEITITATEAKLRKLQEMKINLQSQVRNPQGSPVNTNFYRSGTGMFGRERQTTRNPNPLGSQWNGWRN